jgi:phosphoribosylglycinamide formyltransferase-1
MKKTPNFIIVISTGGSVMNELLKNTFFKSCIHSVISDRDCPALEKASLHHIPVYNFNERNKHLFSNLLLKYLVQNKIDYVISFYTKLFTGNLVKVYKDKIINLHPSILPSFKGLNGFEDTIKYGSRYIGTTIHFIDENMDEGKIIIQTIYPFDYQQEIRLFRHIIFEHQCKSLLQVVKWLEEERILIIADKVVIKNAQFRDSDFSPSLDFNDAVYLKIPLS